MENNRLFIEKIRWHLYEKNKIVFVGWFFDGTVGNRKIKAQLDGNECTVDVTIHKGADVRQKYIGNYNEISEEIIGVISLPTDWDKLKKLVLFVVEEGKEYQTLVMSISQLIKMQGQLENYIESERDTEEAWSISGWAAGEDEIDFCIKDSKGNNCEIELKRYYRNDLKSVFPEIRDGIKAGFQVKVKKTEVKAGEKYLLIMTDGRCSKHYKMFGRTETGAVNKCLGKFKSATRYLKRNGMAATFYKVESKLYKGNKSDYDRWRKKYEITEKELQMQREASFEKTPIFSVVVPLFRTDEKFLCEMIDSIRNQTYSKWELCLADGSADGREQKGSKLLGILKKYSDIDSRIKYTILDENLGISGNTNAALQMATGDYVVLVDHDDIVPPNALFEFATAINRDEKIDVLYSDEDKISMDGKKYFEPHFKSDYNVDLLCSMNYICHLFAVRRSVQLEVGEFSKECEGAQDYDFIFRCCERAKVICHIPKILYHWRCHIDSTAERPESKLYAFEAGRRAVEEHYKRVGIPAHVEHGQTYGMYHTIYDWEEEPLISIIIPNKDHTDDLNKCISSIIQKSSYQNYEILVIENNSTESETFEYYKEIEEKHSNVRVLYYKGEFNYSRINNFGAKEAKGDYLLLLNNDTEIINADCLKELLHCCMRSDVGIVGARLYYEDNTIQHAGVVIGFGGMAGHTFIGKSRYDLGYFRRIVCVQDYSAVTAACMMTKRSVYEAVGGLTEDYRVAFNDIDYCLKVRKLGKLVVYNPYAELYHYESKSRGLEDTPEKVQRFNSEVERLATTWKDIFEAGDPYYNKNLTLDNSDFSLRR